MKNGLKITLLDEKSRHNYNCLFAEYYLQQHLQHGLDVSLSLSVTVRSSKKLLYAVSLGPII